MIRETHSVRTNTSFWLVVILNALLLSGSASWALADDLPAPGTEEALAAGIDDDGVDDSSPGPGPGAVRGPVVVSADLVLREGDNPAGTNGPVTSLNAPFTNGLGEVGFTGRSEGGDGVTNAFVWRDTSVLFLDASVVSPVLSGAEGTMGIGNAGEFIYSPSADGDDSVWTHNGLLQVENVQAPGFPDGVTNTFNSRPQMRPSGQSYWVSGFNESGGTSSEGRILYTSSDSTPGNTTVVLRSDDMVGGFTIDRPSGIDFDYSFSDNGNHHIQVLLMDTGSTADDGFVYVDGNLVARETEPSGDGDNWDNFDIVSINNNGDYLFTGDTDGASSSDEFIAYNGDIVVREGDVLDGQPLTSSATLRAASLNNLGQAVHAWGISGGTEILFASCDAADIRSSSTLLLATGDQVDLDGDGMADAMVDDFNASTGVGPGLSLAEDGFVFIEVDLLIDEGTLEAEATLRLATGCEVASGEPIARFQVVKDFNDDNPSDVDVLIECNTGLPLSQPATVTEGDSITYVVTDFENGAMNCTITEQDVDGYTASYNNGESDSPESCVFENVAWGSFNTCTISNSLDAVDVEVTKWWLDENPQFNAVNFAEASYSCANEVFGEVFGSLEFLGDGAVDGFSVFPDWDGTTSCTVTETVVEGGIEFDDSECLNLSVSPGNGASCNIYNTRLYEGIPTLSAHGLALMALLMLGIGFVAFRRLA